MLSCAGFLIRSPWIYAASVCFFDRDSEWEIQKYKWEMPLQNLFQHNLERPIESLMACCMVQSYIEIILRSITSIIHTFTQSPAV